ncbi:hypothetical protein MARCHEWKA_04150 [Brevundimonas phage vB_BpoS-Marchewka]|uniref:Uncharacterized protein n=1 Tax=Brevundimonas phage vB_BpoS-Marchewka TaxID=2948604 RepID=A0A9E7SU02_9CAUD|nr:hypothetical protein MARCHEWKA_04150 [Brevundimonas phage vB_BpoS-Marchewka]
MYDDILDRPRSFKARVRVTTEYIVEIDCADAAAYRAEVLADDFCATTLLDRPVGKARVERIGAISEVPLPPLSQPQYDTAVLRRLDRGEPLKPEDRIRAIIAGDYYDPVLNPDGVVHSGLVDRSRPMPAMNMRSWAVLAEDGGYRVHAGGDCSPTLHATPAAAWDEFDQVMRDEIVWPENEEDA